MLFIGAVIGLAGTFCLNGFAYAAEYFTHDGEHVRGYAARDGIEIVIDMEVPEYEETLPLFEYVYSNMNERKMLQALNGLVYQKMGQLQWQTNYEKNADERVYDYFETNGQGGGFLAYQAIDCLPYRNTEDPKVVQAEEILLKALEPLDLAIQYPFYFSGRRDDVIRHLFTDNQVSRAMESSVYKGDILGETIPRAQATFIVVRFAVGEYTIEPNGWIYNPNSKPKRKGKYDYDKGGFIIAAIDDQGKIIHIRFYNPIQSVTMKADRVPCVSWETALENMCGWSLQHMPNGCVYKKLTVLQMEICYAIGKNGNAYPVWRISYEEIRRNQVPNTDRIVESLYSQSICADIVNGDVLDPE